MPRVEQIRTLLYNGEEIGMGFNSDTGKALGTALDFDPPTRELAQEVFSEASIITSQQSLMDSMDLSFEAAGRYGLHSANLKVNFHTKTTFNSTSSFVLARSVVRNQITRGRNFRIKPGAKDLLDARKLTEFETAFGDSFVRGIFSGGEYYALIRITSLDTSVQKRLAIMLEAEMNGVVAGGSFSGEFNKANSQSKSHSEFFVTFYQKGGAGAEETGTTLDIDDIRTRLRTFPSAVRDHPFPYQIEVATYNTIPLPLPNKEQTELFLEALSDAYTKKLEYMQRRNDLQFAVNHPEFFFDLPDTVQLINGLNNCTRAINAVVLHALKLSKGEIDPPQYFDPVAKNIEIPTIRLNRRSSESAKTFVDWYLLKNEPSILLEDALFIHQIEQLGRQHIVDFESIETLQLRAEALAPVVAGMKQFWIHGIDKVRSLGHLPDMLPSSLEELSILKCGLREIRGISRFKSLQKLDLSRNMIDDISELAELGQLQYLDLSHNHLSDVSPLKECREIRSLYIGDNSIKVLEPIASLSKLTNLVLATITPIVEGLYKALNNPFLSIDALLNIPAMVNPFLLADELKVRFGVLKDGPNAQFTGLAKRIERSNVFDVTLSRGAESIADRWTVTSIVEGESTFANYIIVQLIGEWWEEGKRNLYSLFIAKSDRTRSTLDPVMEILSTSPDPSISVEVII